MNGPELRTTEGSLLGNFGIDLSLAMSKAFLSRKFQLDPSLEMWTEISFGSQMGHPDGLFLGDCEKVSC